MEEQQLRPAIVARDGLSMPTPACRCVFLLAGGAHGKVLHGGGVPVIGDAVNNAIARATGHTADKWIPISPVFRIP